MSDNVYIKSPLKTNTDTTQAVTVRIVGADGGDLTPGTITAITAAPVKGVLTDRSGTLTTGGTSQQVMAANATRVYLFVQNISAGVMYINFGAAATIDSNSYKIAVNGNWENPAHFCPNGTVTIIGATTGQKWVAKENP